MADKNKIKIIFIFINKFYTSIYKLKKLNVKIK